jgi:protein-S-isoprenylcysteine O-methyltransferase Ste14
LNFTIIVIIISVIWLASEISLARMKRAGEADRRLDRSTLRLLWITIFISVNGGVFLGLQPVGHFSNGSAIAPITGIALIIGGLGVRWYAILSLRRLFTVDVAITKDHRLVKEGIYRWIRHPSYIGSLLSFLGLGLCFSSYLSTIVIFVPICCAFLFRIRVEERALAEAFGDEYTQYRASTKRLIPGIF